MLFGKHVLMFLEKTRMIGRLLRCLTQPEVELIEDHEPQPYVWTLEELLDPNTVFADFSTIVDRRRLKAVSSCGA